MQRRASPSHPSVALMLGVAACTAPGLGHVTDDEPPMTATATSSGEPGGATEDVQPTTGPAPGTTSDDPGTTSLGSGSSGEIEDTTGDQPPGPPAIVGHGLAPVKLQQYGPIAVTIDTVHADGVRMQVDDGDFIELDPAGADSFSGAIAIYTGQANDADHSATFVAWRDGLESAPLTVPFDVDLPPMGSELFWEGDSAIGKGTVVALAVTPEPRLIELGTYYPQGLPRCYLRRRDLGGKWGAGDLVEVKPGIPCSAIDLAVDAEGHLLVLAEKLEDGELRWWLGKIAAWGAEPENVGAGAVGDVAHALASDASRAAVCGTRPQEDHVDAAIWLFADNAPGKILSFDYMSEVDLAHRFDETPGDCQFHEGRLVLAGGLRGKHDGFFDHTRHFVLDVDVAAEQPTWTVAGKTPTVQSEAKSLSVDVDGRVVTGGHQCGDPCDPAAELRLFSTLGQQVWQRSLDASITSPRAVAWHPAGYAVFASTRTTGQDAASFMAQAWFALLGEPTWSYEHQGPLAVHTATAVAIGPYGQIYAGGTTAGGYPAIAIIAP